MGGEVVRCHHGRMKMRFRANCPLCRVQIPQGHHAARFFGGYAHPTCVIAWRERREALRAR